MLVDRHRGLRGVAGTGLELDRPPHGRPLAVVVLGVLGLMSLASWTAYRVGTYVESRARSAPVLLAARRLVTDPRPAGRAAAAVGVLLGAGFLGVVAGNASSPWSALILLADIVGTLGLVWLAISVAVRLTRPWAVRAASPANLRTE